MVEIAGYPLDASSLRDSQVPHWVGNDPVVGRLACPPLSRINLQSLKSEAVMVKKISVIESSGKTGWEFEPRSDLHWWAGGLVTSEDFAAFIRSHLPEVVKTKGVGRWSLPSFQTEVLKSGIIKISWERTPEFGPYIFNGVSLSRPASNGIKFPPWECVGLYQIELAAEDRFRLTPSKSYAGNRAALEFVDDQRSGIHRKLVFEMAQSQVPALTKSETATEAPCSTSIELPLVTIISWNTASGVTASAEVRRALTQLTPRGELVRTGAASMGEVLSAPIPRLHPGYDRSAGVRPYSLEQAAAALDAQGLKRDKADEPRLGKDKVPLKLEVHSPGISNSLLEKVLTDAFSLAGIGLEFSKSSAKTFDGTLAGVRLSSPDSDFIRNFHSQAPKGGMFQPLQNRSLDSALEAYALSLTSEVPDFKLLQQVHRILYEVEPVTTLLQHRACLVTFGAGWNRAAKVDGRDPDWFRKLYSDRKVRPS